MALSKDAQRIYGFLVQEVLPGKKVVTYGETSRKTGVPLGEGGGAVRIALYEIFQECDRLQLPPLTSIVVQSPVYDSSHRHGMPGGGYLVAEAFSPNQANRRRDDGWRDWQRHPRPNDAETWLMKNMIEVHQDSVWSYTGTWPQVI